MVVMVMVDMAAEGVDMEAAVEEEVVLEAGEEDLEVDGNEKISRRSRAYPHGVLGQRIYNVQPSIINGVRFWTFSTLRVSLPEPSYSRYIFGSHANAQLRSLFSLHFSNNQKSNSNI